MRRVITILIVVLLSTIVAQGQIKIGGNVYGGGNHAEVRGSTKVTVLKGDIGAVMDPDETKRPLADPAGKVFGGARMANVGGNSFVHIDGEHASGYILINQVFGGNDIAGTIGTAAAIPTELTAVKKTEADATDYKKNAVDPTFNSFVRISTKALNETYNASEVSTTDPENPAYGKTAGVDVKPDPTAEKVYIGQLFGGGNGDFDYEQTPSETAGKVIHTIYNRNDHTTPIAQVETDEGEVGFQLPEQDKTYLEIKGGSIVYGYGGGNNATVKKQAIIHIDNPSAVVNHILVDADGNEGNDETYAAYETNTLPTGYTDLLTTARFKEMGINTTFSQPSSGAYQVGRFFGGNNKAEMSIRPTWNLLAGKVRNLYSGGNRGNMTSPEGLLLEIKNYSTLIVDNLYGGCRMADVKPTVNGKYVPCTNLEGYYFPSELSARVLVNGGHINNVYGGNDVTGVVYGGNAVGIHTTVYGDVYGGGNGAYPYTDAISEEDETYGDFHYTVTGSSIDALNAFRPNAEQVSLHLWGDSPTKPTVIHGSVFVGGNCASLSVKKSQPLVELKIGSHVIADNVYLGNNGEGMLNRTYLEKYADDNFSTLNLTNSETFSSYMDAVAMTLMPKIVFDSEADGDRNNYKEYSSYIGSFFCGGNVGSMAIPGKMAFSVKGGLNIFRKFVGGCNNANVKAQAGLNAAYEGGVIGSEDERDNYTDGDGKIKDRLEINFENMTVVPMRWDNEFTQVAEGTKLTEGKEYYRTNLRSSKFIADGTEPIADKAKNTYYELTAYGTKFEWNTAYWNQKEEDFKKLTDDDTDVDEKDLRLLDGNIYGGCYNSGHVNGNVVININEDVVKKDQIFRDFGNSTTNDAGYTKPAVAFEGQRDDVMTSAMYVYGAGHGKDTEIWGSTTINHNNGYAFQLFGGGEQGAVGKRQLDANGTPALDTDGNYIYAFDPKYSTTVNLNGTTAVYSHEGTVENLAEAEYLYGGGNEGIVAGNTLVNLGNGRIYDAFGGASDADILGHTEVFVGRQPDGSGGYKDGFPWVRDIVYGGNDFGGTILGAYEDTYNFEARLRDYDTYKTQIHGYKADEIPDVLKSSSYVEYLQGRVDSIFGGSYGSYNYSNTALYGEGCSMPKQTSAFVNIRPKDHAQNYILHAYGGGTGYPGAREDDGAQERSYVLVDIPDGMTYFGKTEVFGAGCYNGIGMNYTPAETFAEGFNLDKASAIIDLLHGRIHNAYGGSYREGITRRTVVNVPAESSIQIDSIFGGAYGKEILPPCDVYETQVNYKNTSEKAQVFGAIFGGNNNERRSLFTQVNISSPVYSNKEKGYTGTVYGAGRGIDTWSEHTEVNLLSGARVYNVYGGGEMGHVLNSASVQAYMNLFKDNLSRQISQQDPFWNSTKDGAKYTIVNGNRVPATDALKIRWRKDWANAWKMGDYYNPIVGNNGNDGQEGSYDYSTYAQNAATNLDRFSNRSEIDDNIAKQLDGKKKHNTNVIVNKGAIVEGYAYGGGLGDASVAQTGDIYGSTYIAVLGGEVKKDVYAGGRAGGVDNLFGATDFDDEDNTFVATANAYIQGGTARNVYGGGYEGHVGHHDGAITTTTAGDRPAEAYVVIGKQGTDTFDGGAPAITRNVYGGGEGGSVYGSSKVSVNNGYIGYRYKNTGSAETPKYEYVEELDDQKPGDLELSGNVFGGGYVVNSYVDSTTVNMYGGTVRGSLYGGGEIGPIGRGTMLMSESQATAAGGKYNEGASIFRAGTTNVNMFDGLVKRNVFGGGRGKDSWGGDGTKYMDPDLVATLDLKCKGYVFGQTHVNIHGGEIGTAEGMAYGYGNVFGGGDEGSVYSAYTDKFGALQIGAKSGTRYDKDKEGYYYNNGGKLTEDCKVVVEPYCLVVKNQVDIDKVYAVGTYVPTSALNKLKGKNPDTGAWESQEWESLDSRGIIIHNAVFAGGNIAAGSSTQNANEKTVFGNATASIHDAYNRDLITIGTGHTGGLYGDGNLTFVDGYRELNITNYGTDYQHIKKQLTYDQYKVLPEREQAYYELKYKCLVECTDIDKNTYSVGSNLPMDELLAQFTNTDGTSVKVGDVDIIITDPESGKRVPNPVVWQENGVVTVYAGRIMNTIQRADFCGVFGSRMVMKGAQDRVPEEVDYTNYTINRVREVSLNKKHTTANDPETIVVDNKTIPNPNYEHGNYFGIYSVVNYLGALTSDVTFDKVRVTENTDANRYKTAVTIDNQPYAYGTASYYQWKQAHIGDRTRNNGSCHNQLALASGVYLELTSEEKTGNTVDTKEWGPITGVVELDLINVQPGMGGGFVYAKNIHGVRSTATNPLPPLTTLNTGAASQKNYKYDTTDAAYSAGTGQYQWETSGNFIHSTQTIIDDCYNISNRYYGTGKVPAHYWYIAGSVYVYDQYISAYTGSPNAYSETVEIPISISAASNGTMTLLDVQPNFYAYYKSYTNETTNTPLSGDQKLVINDVTYQQNDPISYWDYKKLTAAQQKLFVKDTYVLKDSCYINSKYYPAGYVMLPAEYQHLETQAAYHEVDGESVKAVKKATKDANGNPVVEKDKNDNDVYVGFYDAFRSSNNLSHNTGYQLTYNVTNPAVWNKWYTKLAETGKITLEAYNKLTASDQANYTDGPTYHPTSSGLYGQQDYDINAIIPEKTVTDYNKLKTNHSGDIPSGQAEFTAAYLVTKECTSNNQHYYPGAPVSAEISGCTVAAYVSTATIQLSATEYIYVNDLMTKEQKDKYKTDYSSLAADIEAVVKPAYICTKAGKYGGSYYVEGQNYRALEAYSAMSPEDREHFQFNYDALDLLIDPNFSGAQGKKYQYDGENYTTKEHAANNPATYSLPTPLDYTATYNGTSDATAHNGITRTNGGELTRAQYESLPNEQRHYAPIAVTSTSDTYYVVKEDFIHGDEAYAIGTTISNTIYNSLTESEQNNKIAKLTKFPAAGTYYYCRDKYKIGEKGEGVTPTLVTGINGADENAGIVNDSVTVGTIIKDSYSDSDKKGYVDLPNYQTNFTIHGISPMETSTLYVARYADINDLSTEKIITVIYQYDYEESDESGNHITPVTERHVVNIHINFKSGVPTVEDINPPTIVLPGTGITMRVPTVTPGAYEITGGGWELFDNPDDAESHINGVPYTPSVDPLYWYQDGFYLAYYAKTYLGKTYSNHVPVSVANYHDLKRVMDDKATHLHVDYDRTRLKRDSKIYINDYSASSENGLDLFKDFYDLSLLTSESTGVDNDVVTAEGRLKDHHILNQTNGPKAGENLEFILRTDIYHGPTTIPNPEYNPEDPSSSETKIEEHPWTTIGTDDICFKGNLHGDGHTISGLDKSLFYNLCGSVYNLGVTGSFNTAGVADKGPGYVESAWVKTTNDTPLGTKPYAVFGAPSDNDGYQVVNSYYYDGNNNLYNTTTTTNGVTTSGGNRGTARAMTAKEFYNGTVAYNLNNFYLYKRYCDKQVTSGTERYSYFTIGDDGKLVLQNNHYYAPNADLCSTGHEDKDHNVIMYVEDRFADGDFVFAAGEIPTTENERFYSWKGTDSETIESSYFPIWPDDYIYFGQKLTYGWAAEAHQNVPTAVVREDGRLSTGTYANRVYRAPAYYRSKEMGVAHFNPQVYLAQKERLTTEQIEAHVTAREAYPNMTAIDFHGHNDVYEVNGAKKAYELGLNNGKFYAPLLDDDGLLSIQNCDETQNLVVYAPAADVNAKTHGVLSGYFKEPVYDMHYDNSMKYRLVAEASPASVHGHLVQSNLKAINDHLLVDRQDFNAPVGYSFDTDHLMWYQRIPADKEYVDTEKGWQDISLPFTAELVTTNQKGEITHFYSGSSESENGTGTKKGHEYWLRELTNGDTMKPTTTDVVVANFHYPNAEGDGKTVENSFLWNYYYKNEDVHEQQDANSDIYLQYRHYYETPRSYANYPLLKAATPYILGLPGETYYEFDLSGKFRAENTKVSIPQLGKQIITFASATGATIGVSDNEMSKGTVVKYGGNDYTFKPSYMNEALEASSNSYTLNAAGSSFNKVTATTNVSAFRPYFTVAASASSAPQKPKQIVFGGANSSLEDGPETVLNGELVIYAKDHKIITTSHLKEATTITIFNVAGINFANYVLKPGETVETPIVVDGVYIVNKKKLFVK